MADKATIEVMGLVVESDGENARLHPKGDDRVFVWTWPIGVYGSPPMSFGEELAKALAQVDGTFEVRHLGR